MDQDELKEMIDKYWSNWYEGLINRWERDESIIQLLHNDWRFISKAMQDLIDD